MYGRSERPQGAKKTLSNLKLKKIKKRDRKRKRRNDRKRNEYMSRHTVGVESLAAAQLSKQELAMKKEEREIMKEIGGDAYEQYLLRERDIILAKQASALAAAQAGASTSSVAKLPDPSRDSETSSSSDSSSDDDSSTSFVGDDRKPAAKPTATKRKSSLPKSIIAVDDSSQHTDVSLHESTLNSHPVTQEDMMSRLYSRFPSDPADPKAPDPRKCHLCQLHDGHICHTEGCLGMICSLCNVGVESDVGGSPNELKYICHWCNPSLEVLYSPAKNITGV